MKPKTQILLIVIGDYLLLTYCTRDNPPVTENYTPIINDADMDIDNASALLYLPKHTGKKTDTISIYGTGMSYLNPATDNILDFIKSAGKQEIPNVCGDTGVISSNPKIAEIENCSLKVVTNAGNEKGITKFNPLNQVCLLYQLNFKMIYINSKYFSVLQFLNFQHSRSYG